MTIKPSPAFQFFTVTVLDTKSENHAYGDPDISMLQEAVQDFMNLDVSEDSVTVGTHEFYIWQNAEDDGDHEMRHVRYVNAYTLPENGGEREYTTYYQVDARPVVTNKLSPAQRTAMNTFLCDFPEGLYLHEVMLLITQGSDEVVLWEQVEDWHTGTVIESIEDLAKNIQELLDAKERHW